MTISTEGSSYAISQRLGSNQTICAIGDIHGRADLLKRMLAFVPDEALVVFTGDLIDRGPHSLACIDLAMSIQNGIACMGNHEQMLLIALQEESPHSRAGLSAWLGNGGAVFAKELLGDVPPTARAVANALGDDRLAWMRRMKSHHRVGEMLFVHAGLSPTLPVDPFLSQPWDLDLKHLDEDNHWAWIREPFLKSSSHHGLFVVHGHTPDDGLSRIGASTIAQNRVNLDLGSYSTGRARLVQMTDQFLVVWDFKGKPL